jgi:tetratricopeptide (TPR) repeat protein
MAQDPVPGGSGNKAVVLAVVALVLVGGGGALAWLLLSGDAADGSLASADEAPALEQAGAEAADDTAASEEEPSPEPKPTEPVVVLDGPEEPEETEPEPPNPMAPLPPPATDCATAPECNTRGFRFYQAKAYDMALPYFSAALKRDPGHVKALYNSACMFAILGRTEDAITMLRRLAVMDDPEARNRIRKVATDSDFDGVRGEPEFREAMQSFR